MSAGAPRWQPVVRVVARLRLRTATKAFCNCAVDPAEAAPNVHTCPVCLGLPGALPVLNVAAVERGARLALALGARVPPVSVFGRRHEFAPTLPKGYRTTQHDAPLALGGALQIGETTEGGAITTSLTSMRLDEEPGRALHVGLGAASGLDFNLAGAPILRVASCAELHTPEEAVAFVRALRRAARAAGASDARFDDGSLRLRLAVSVRPLGETGVRPPCDVRGADSLAAVHTAVAAEAARQAAEYTAGRGVERHQYLWDADSGTAVPARARRPDGPPRWLPEPDLPPLVLTSEWLDAQRAHVPAFPPSRRRQLAEHFGLDARTTAALVADPELADYYEGVARRARDPRAAAEWVLGPVLAAVEAAGADLEAFSLRVRPADVGDLVALLGDGRLGPSGARHVFGEMVRSGDPPARVVAREGLRLADRPRA